MSLVCPNCQYDRNPKNSEFCEVCGQDLRGMGASTSASTPVSANPVQATVATAPGTVSATPAVTATASTPTAVTPPAQTVISGATSVASSKPATGTLVCSVCGYDNPMEVSFCESCGSGLPQASTPTTSAPSETPTVVTPPPTVTSASQTISPTSQSAPSGSTPSTSAIAKLIVKQANVPVSEFVLNPQVNLIGRFDSETGPVDVDLDDFANSDTVSRQHGELFYESGRWKIKDLGSSNGIFIRRSGDGRFSSRIVAPEFLSSGDEIAIGKIILLFQS